MTMKFKRRPSVAALTAMSVIFLTACAGGGSASSGGSSASSAGSTSAALESSSPVLTAATARVAQLIKGTSVAPSGDPVRAQTGKKVFIISCIQAASACSVPTAGAVEASKLLGWSPTVLDDKADYAQQGPLIDQAIAAGAQGIMMIGNDCQFSPAALQRAKAHHIAVVNVYGADCNESYAPGDPVGLRLWTDVPTATAITGPAFFQQWAAGQG